MCFNSQSFGDLTIAEDFDTAIFHLFYFAAFYEVSGVTTVPASNASKVETLMVEKVVLNFALLKPRFGRRRWIGVWPPSNAGPLPPPERAF